VVSILVLICCAVRPASASILSPSSEPQIAADVSADLPADSVVLSSVLVASDNSDGSWDFPANLRSDHAASFSIANPSLADTMSSASPQSPWQSPPTELVFTEVAPAPLQPPTDLHSSPPGESMQLMSVASIAIPLPTALAATAVAILPIAFFGWLWKKSHRSCD
jgi:hypothetical protein